MLQDEIYTDFPSVYRLVIVRLSSSMACKTVDDSFYIVN